MVEGRFLFPFPLLRFPAKPVKASHRRSSGFIPPEKPFPSSQPEWLIRVGDCCSPGLGHLSGFPSGNPHREASPFPSLPSRPSVAGDLSISDTGNLRVSLSPARHFPPKRAPACLVFRADRRPPPLEEVNPPLIIFSSRGPKPSCDGFGASLRGGFLPALRELGHQIGRAHV